MYFMNLFIVLNLLVLPLAKADQLQVSNQQTSTLTAQDGFAIQQALLSEKTITAGKLSVAHQKSLIPTGQAPVLDLSKVAQGTEGLSGGGNDLGLEFQDAFNMAMKRSKDLFPALYAKMQKAGIASKSSDMVIVVTDKLTVVRDGVAQDSVAQNFPQKGLILLNSDRWNALGSDRVREGIALHEYASLRGVENTGNYTYSAQYVANFGFSQNDLTETDVTALQLQRVAQWVLRARCYSEEANALFTGHKNVDNGEIDKCVDGWNIDDDISGFYGGSAEFQIADDMIQGFAALHYANMDKNKAKAAIFNGLLQGPGCETQNPDHPEDWGPGISPRCIAQLFIDQKLVK